MTTATADPGAVLRPHAEQEHRAELAKPPIARTASPIATGEIGSASIAGCGFSASGQPRV